MQNYDVGVPASDSRVTWIVDIYIYVTGAIPTDPDFEANGGAVYMVIVHSGSINHASAQHHMMRTGYETYCGHLLELFHPGRADAQLPLPGGTDNGGGKLQCMCISLCVEIALTSRYPTSQTRLNLEGLCVCGRTTELGIAMSTFRMRKHSTSLGDNKTSKVCPGERFLSI